MRNKPCLHKALSSLSSVTRRWQRFEAMPHSFGECQNHYALNACARVAGCGSAAGTDASPSPEDAHNHSRQRDGDEMNANIIAVHAGLLEKFHELFRS